MNEQPFKTAIARRRPAARSSSRRASPHFSRGETYRRYGRLQAAIAEYKRAVELHPENAYYRYRLGDCYAAAGFLQDAIVELEMACSLCPSRSAGSNAGAQIRNLK